MMGGDDWKCNYNRDNKKIMGILGYVDMWIEA